MTLYLTPRRALRLKDGLSDHAFDMMERKNTTHVLRAPVL